MLQQTVLNPVHRALGAKMVDFGGWEMPIHYGSQIEEHHQVRRDAGMFDVSHMTVVDLHGGEVRAFLRELLANDIGKLKRYGKALYTCMLNERGGVIDDLIVYYGDESRYRLVVNAATRAKDLAWLRIQAMPHGVTVRVRDDLAMIAVQGPNAREKVLGLLAGEDAERVQALGRFEGVKISTGFFSRTGYTGEDGFEIMLDRDAAAGFWQNLIAAGVQPAGLGARDTLRLEAGMALYGQDMDETVSPYEAGLGWTVSLSEDRDFIGKAALLAQLATGVPRQTVGLVMDEKGVLRHGQQVHAACGDGEILSGTFSPTLGLAIALARLPAGDPGAVSVDIRGRVVPVRVVRYPFVRDGQAQPGVRAD